VTAKQFSAWIDASIYERAKATVVGLTGATGEQWTLARLATSALSAFCREMEERYNDGEPWPTVTRLKAGRPFGP